MPKPKIAPPEMPMKATKPKTALSPAAAARVRAKAKAILQPKEGSAGDVA